MTMMQEPVPFEKLAFAQRQVAAVERFFFEVKNHPLTGMLMQQRREYFEGVAAEVEDCIRSTVRCEKSLDRD